MPAIKPDDLHGIIAQAVAKAIRFAEEEAKRVGAGHRLGGNIVI